MACRSRTAETYAPPSRPWPAHAAARLAPSPGAQVAHVQGDVALLLCVVLRRIDGALDDTVLARRPITVQDLLTFRCGHRLILAPPGRYPIQKAIADLGIFGPPDRALPLEGDAWIQRAQRPAAPCAGGGRLVVRDGLEHPGGRGGEGVGPVVVALLRRASLSAAGDEGHRVLRAAGQPTQPVSSCSSWPGSPSTSTVLRNYNSRTAKRCSVGSGTTASARPRRSCLDLRPHQGATSFTNSSTMNGR